MLNVPGSSPHPGLLGPLGILFAVVVAGQGMLASMDRGCQPHHRLPSAEAGSLI